MYSVLKLATATLILAASGSFAITLDTGYTSSAISAARTIVDRIISTYHGTEPGEIPGLFPSPYYWWESGLAWDALVNYWAQTGDDTYNDIVNEALVWQVGENNDFFPLNQTKTIGNDDQAFWALAAMTAAEYGFPAPAGDLIRGSNLTWLQLAENVFNEQVRRWDEDTCAGGLRWQIFTFNSGYNYKNSLSNGNFYQLASRLNLYTGNLTYSQWAEKALSWSGQTGLLSNETGAVFDGFSTSTNCSDISRLQWTASSGTYLSGAAYLQNHSSTTANSDAPFSLLSNFKKTFTRDNVLFEVACETNSNCNMDQLAFKAIASRALVRIRDLTSHSSTIVNGTDYGTLQEQTNSLIQASARAAAAQCSGGATGTVCGTSWLNNTWDGTSGLGQDLSALEIILATLPGKALRNANSFTESPTPATGINSTIGGNTTSSASSSHASSTSTTTTSASGKIVTSMSSMILSLIFVVTFATGEFIF